ncbi:MAG: hypothetical protein K9K79_12730 [Desulfohalobiaceae bacterium]|nr:hypothetical protein [Desulfohalobiaceae bacterium]
MLRISKQTKSTPEEIIDRAVKYFGEGGENLDEVSRDACCVTFEGGGGYVRVSIADESGQRTVDIETREFDYPAKEFLGRL